MQRISGGHLVQHPSQSRAKFEQLDWGIVHLSFEYLLEPLWETYSRACESHQEVCFTTIYSEFHLVRLVPSASCPVTVPLQEEPGLVFSVLSYWLVRDSNKIIIHNIKLTNSFAVQISNLHVQDNVCTFK